MATKVMGAVTDGQNDNFNNPASVSKTLSGCSYRIDLFCSEPIINRNEAVLVVKVSSNGPFCSARTLYGVVNERAACVV